MKRFKHRFFSIISSMLLYPISGFTFVSFHIPRKTVQFSSIKDVSEFGKPHSKNTLIPLYMGYEFGDVSKAVAKKVTNAVNKKNWEG